MLTALRMSPGLLSDDPVRINFRRVLLNHAPPNVTSATTSFVAGTKIVFGANKNSAIPWSMTGFIAVGNTGMVWLLNIFCSEHPLLV